jgi:ParB-like chromosome segregation protein Spo0J
MIEDNNLEIINLPTMSLIPYAKNNRIHTPAQVRQIAGSIKEFGFNNPVLIDEENTIIAGHGRVLAAELLGADRVPCIKLTHLSEIQRRAYRIADNKLTLNSEWDDEMLALELESLMENQFDMELTGFSSDERGSTETK